jgi:hypothetical protein
MGPPRRHDRRGPWRRHDVVDRTVTDVRTVGVDTAIARDDAEPESADALRRGFHGITTILGYL